MALVNFYAAAREASGTSSLKIPAGNLAALVTELSAKNAALKKLLPTCSFLINGESIEDPSHPLIEGDVVEVLPQFAGG